MKELLNRDFFGIPVEWLIEENPILLLHDLLEIQFYLLLFFKRLFFFLKEFEASSKSRNLIKWF